MDRVGRANDAIGQAKVDVTGLRVIFEDRADRPENAGDGAIIYCNNSLGSAALGGDPNVAIRKEAFFQPRYAAETADAFGVFIRVRPISNNAILDVDNRVEQVDGVIVPGTNDAMGHEQLPARRIVQVNAIGVVGTCHLVDPGIAADQRGGGNLRAHAGTTENAVIKNQIGASCLHDFADRGAVGGCCIRNHGRFKNDP